MDNPELPDVFILSVDDYPVAHMPKSKLAAVMNYDQVIPKCTTLSLIDDGKEFTGLKIRKLDFDLSFRYCDSTAGVVKFIARWAQSRSAEDAFWATYKRATPSDNFPSGVFEEFIMEMFEGLRLFEPNIHTDVLDYVVDFVIDCIREDYLHETHGGSIVEDLIKRWINASISVSKSPTKMHSVFANYILHHQNGEVDPDFEDNEGEIIIETVQSWKEKVWSAKDFSILPQEITAEDFNDYCRYHTHEDSRSCYRKKQK
ncbi:hypothetical protein KCV07_g8741, partial [Aureobasidium melanogenum]